MSEDIRMQFNAEDNLSHTIDRINDGLGRTQTETTNTSKATTQMGSAMNKVVGIMGAYISVTRALAFAKSSLTNATADLRAEINMSQMLRVTGQALRTTSSEMKELAESISEVNRVTTQQVIEAQSQLMVYNELGRDTFPRVLQLSADLANVFGSMASASSQLGRAINDPVRGIRLLNRQGITFNQTTEDQIRNMVELGNVSGAQALILEELEGRFAGLNVIGESQIDTLDDLRKRYDEIKSEIGQQLLPVLISFQQVLNSIASVMRDHGDLIAMGVFVASAPAIIGALKGITIAIKAKTGAITANTIALYANPLFLAGSVLAGSIYLVIKAVSDMNKEVEDLNEEMNSLMDVREFTTDSTQGFQDMSREIENMTERTRDLRREIQEIQMRELDAEALRAYREAQEDLQRYADAQRRADAESTEAINEKIEKLKEFDTLIKDQIALVESWESVPVNVLQRQVSLDSERDKLEKLKKSREELAKIIEKIEKDHRENIASMDRRYIAEAEERDRARATARILRAREVEREISSSLLSELENTEAIIEKIYNVNENQYFQEYRLLQRRRDDNLKYANEILAERIEVLKKEYKAVDKHLGDNEDKRQEFSDRIETLERNRLEILSRAEIQYYEGRKRITEGYHRDRLRQERVLLKDLVESNSSAYDQFERNLQQSLNNIDDTFDKYAGTFVEHSKHLLEPFDALRGSLNFLEADFGVKIGKVLEQNPIRYGEVTEELKQYIIDQLSQLPVVSEELKTLFKIEFEGILSEETIDHIWYMRREYSKFFTMLRDSQDLMDIFKGGFDTFDFDRPSDALEDILSKISKLENIIENFDGVEIVDWDDLPEELSQAERQILEGMEVINEETLHKLHMNLEERKQLVERYVEERNRVEEKAERDRADFQRNILHQMGMSEKQYQDLRLLASESAESAYNKTSEERREVEQKVLEDLIRNLRVKENAEKLSREQRVAEVENEYQEKLLIIERGTDQEILLAIWKEEQLNEIAREGAEEWKGIMRDKLSDWEGVESASMNAIGQLSRAYNDREMRLLTERHQHEMNTIRNSRMSRRAQAQEMERLQKEQAQEKYAIDKAQWRNDLIMSVVNTHLGIARTMANMGLPQAIPFMIAAGIAGTSASVAIGMNKPNPPKFANGGFVQGASYTGDRVDARVNSGEAILNPSQQREFMSIANGQRPTSQRRDVTVGDTVINVSGNATPEAIDEIDRTLGDHRQQMLEMLYEASDMGMIDYSRLNLQGV